MSAALGSGWLVALAAIVIPFVIVPLAKWLVALWRQPLQEEIAARRELQMRFNESQDKIADLRLKNMFLQAKNEACESELDHWRSGKWVNK